MKPTSLGRSEFEKEKIGNTSGTGNHQSKKEHCLGERKFDRHDAREHGAIGKDCATDPPTTNVGKGIEFRWFRQWWGPRWNHAKRRRRTKSFGKWMGGGLSWGVVGVVGVVQLC